MLGLGSNISKTGKLGVHDLGIVTSNLVLKHNYDLSSVQPLSSGAAVFDGDNDYIELGSQSGDLRLSGSNGSITAWVNPTVVGDDYQRIVDKSDGGDGANGYAFILHDDGTVQCSVDGSTAVAGLIVLTAQKWQHLAWTWDGTNHKLYVDGVLDVSNASSAKPPSDTTNMRIGTWNHATAREYKGYMCNVGIFEEALSQPQIKSIMNKNYDSLSASEKTDLVSWWNLDSTTTQLATAVYDNHHGGGELLSGELGENMDFEDGFGELASGLANGWRSARGNLTQNTTTPYQGTSAQSVTNPAGNNGNVYLHDSSFSGGEVIGAIYNVSFWAKNIKGSGGYFQSQNYDIANVDISNTDWTFYSFSALCDSTSGIGLIFYTDANNTNDTNGVSVDNVSVTRVNGNTGTLS